jgi:hypothetical protein
MELYMAIQTYVHEQTIPSQTWDVMHSLGSKFVNIDVMIDYNGQLETILPKNIISLTDNQIQVTFNSPFTGKARVTK